MKPSEATQGQLTSLNDIISSESKTEPQVTKITRKIVTTTQPVTQTYTTKRVVTTTTKVSQPIQNTRYSNTSSSSPQNVTKINTIKYTKPTTQTTSTYNRPVTNINNKSNNANNQSYRNYQKPEIQSKQPSRIQNSQSYTGNRNQPKRPEVSSSNYKPRFNSPSQGSEKRRTINRGKSIENVQITHIIYSSRPLEFHITEDLNMDNLNTQPINISEEKRNDLQKSGKIEVSCSCDNIEIKKPEVDLNGTLTHYQHAQGIGMTDDKKENINPQFYSSEIKSLEPLAFNKGEPHIEVLEFRSAGKNYNTARTVNKPSTKPMVTTTNRSVNSYTPSKPYNISSQMKNYSSASNRGGLSGVKTTTTRTNYRGNSNTGSGGQIVKETTTQVKMGSRSQYQNPSQPKITTSTERKVYNQSNFLKNKN